MAAARLDLASVFLYAGSIMPGRVGDREVTIIDAFEAVGACVRGLITREAVTEIEKAICPGEGACGGMYTANTMASAAEALGMSLPGSAAPPAVDRRRDGFARKSGMAVVEMLRQGITARKILTKEAFENAIAVTMAFGGPGVYAAGLGRGVERELQVLRGAGARHGDDLDAQGLEVPAAPAAPPRRRPRPARPRGTDQGLARTTSIAWVPIEPVDPRMTTSRGSPHRQVSRTPPSIR